MTTRYDFDYVSYLPIRLSARVDVQLARLRDTLVEVREGYCSPYEALAVARTIETFAALTDPETLARAEAATSECERLAER
jgi:hypothetical protein